VSPEPPVMLGKPPCDSCCPHAMADADGVTYSAAGVAWCCRCKNVLLVPLCMEFEEKTHGIMPPGIPRLFMPQKWVQWSAKRDEQAARLFLLDPDCSF